MCPLASTMAFVLSLVRLNVAEDMWAIAQPLRLITIATEMQTYLMIIRLASRLAKTSLKSMEVFSHRCGYTSQRHRTRRRKPKSNASSFR